MQGVLSHPKGLSHGQDAGARNLLLECAQARPGERLLIAYEHETHRYFDPKVRESISASARTLGLRVEMVDVGFDPAPSGLKPDLLQRLPEVDIVLFLARLGDQLRFSDLPRGARFVVCFAIDQLLLGSAFGTASYTGFCEVKSAVDACMLASKEIVITCPLGTRIVGHLPPDATDVKDTTSMRFPMSIFSPVPADHFSGRAVLNGFLTGTGARYYDDYTVEFDAPLAAILESGRLAGFEGAPGDVARADQQYDRVAGLFGLDRNAVHSWHAGIHPGCGFPWAMRGAYEKWGGAAFGNPRILHFHTCGATPPGEISWNLIDPTIRVDGTAIWEGGRLHLERIPGGGDILARFADLAALFRTPDRRIGL